MLWILGSASNPPTPDLIYLSLFNHFSPVQDISRFQVCYQKVWWELQTSKWTPGCHVKLGCDHLIKKLQPFNHLCLAIIKLEHNLTLKLPSFKNYISCLNINLSLIFLESSAGLFYFLVKIRANPVWPFDPSTLGLQLKFNVKFPTQLTISYISYILLHFIVFIIFYFILYIYHIL